MTAQAYSVRMTAAPARSYGIFDYLASGTVATNCGHFECTEWRRGGECGDRTCGHQRRHRGLFANANTDLVIDIDGYFAPLRKHRSAKFLSVDSLPGSRYPICYGVSRSVWATFDWWRNHAEFSDVFRALAAFLIQRQPYSLNMTAVAPEAWNF